MIRLALSPSSSPLRPPQTAWHSSSNQHSRAVAVELSGRQTVWPGNDQVFLLERGEKKSVPCEAGQTICWAAWVNGDAGPLTTADGSRPSFARPGPHPPES